MINGILFFGDTSNNAMKGATQVTDDFNKGVY